VVSTHSADTHSTRLPLGDWHVVPADSELGFVTRILFGLVPVRGSYSGVSGELHVDGAGNASGELLIDAATVSTGIGKRDRHLRSNDFFAADEHPHVRFTLATLVPTADGSLALTGTLHIREHELAIDTPITAEAIGADRLRVNADFNVDHRASGLRASGSGWKKVPETLHVNAALTLERNI